MFMHHIFVNENQINEGDKSIVILKASDSENFDHLYKSLRINVGEIVLCTPMPFNYDFSYKCEVMSLDDEKIILSITNKAKANELSIKINLYQGLPKSDKLEFIIEKAVELGVNKIIPVEMTNSVSKINDKADKKNDRYMKIAKSAAEQSKRNIVPEVTKAIKYDQMLGEISGTKTIVFYEEATGIEKTRKYLRDIKNEKVSTLNIIVGPEGGFTEKEVMSLKEKGAECLSLGSRILRTETAAITALSIIMYEME